MERGVEAGDLGHLGLHAPEEPPDRREVVRLMQRGERDQLFKHGHHGSMGANRLRVVQPTVYDRVPDPTRRSPASSVPQKRHQEIKRASVTELRPLVPRLLRRYRPVVPLRDEVGLRVDSFHLRTSSEVRVPRPE